jgi:nitroreductase
MKSGEFLNILKTRRSVRRFLPDLVPKSHIEMMITAASWAPSGTNKQNWEFIVVDSKQTREKMKDAVESFVRESAGRIMLTDAKKAFQSYALHFSFFGEAPLVIAVVKKPYESAAQKILTRYKILAAKSSAGEQGPAAAIENLLLMAHILGYGACWMTGPLIARNELENILGITSPDELMAIVPIGLPAEVPKPTKRKAISEFTRYL